MSGVIGIVGKAPDLDAASLVHLGLYALQHRGQESAGIAVADAEGTVRLRKGLGLVADSFSRDDLKRLPGRLAVGHVGYTGGIGGPGDVQPFLGHTVHGQVAVAHTGQLTNGKPLRAELQATGSVFHSSTDAEVILHLLARRSGHGLARAVRETAAMLQGGFSGVVMDGRHLVGFRDPAGIRPLCWGGDERLTAVASESAALASLGIKEWQDVPPGHIVVIDEEGARLIPFAGPAPPAPCAFEFIYFARPDSEMEGRNVHQVRQAIGRVLWEERPVEADVVIPAPDSGTSGAMGFSKASGIPLEIGLMKNRYVGRTFIQPSQDDRELGVRIKLNPIRSILAGRRVVVIDDSIVRGTTSRKMISLIRDAGATEVHMYVASPPFRHLCPYGIHMRSPRELVASNRSPEEIRRYIGADSLHYLSYAGLARAIGRAPGALCLGCMTGEYPVATGGEEPGLRSGTEGRTEAREGTTRGG